MYDRDRLAEHTPCVVDLLHREVDAGHLRGRDERLRAGDREQRADDEGSIPGRQRAGGRARRRGAARCGRCRRASAQQQSQCDQAGRGYRQTGHGASGTQHASPLVAGRAPGTRRTLPGQAGSGRARRAARPCAMRSQVRMIRATQTRANPIQRSTGMASCMMNTPKRNCRIGARYWMRPSPTRLRRLAAEANSRRGTAVTTPAESSSTVCVVLTVPKTMPDVEPTMMRMTDATGTSHNVSRVSPVMASTDTPARFLMSPYSPNDMARINAIQGREPNPTASTTMAPALTPIATHCSGRRRSRRMNTPSSTVTIGLMK